MTTEEYIASGILDVYACGGLSAAEAEAVAKMVQKHPEIKAELDRIEAALENFALLQATPPPANLKNKILSQLPQASQTETVAETDQKVRSITENAPEVSSHSGYSWLAAAAVILLLLSAALNFYFYNNWQKAENTLAIALNENLELAGNFKQARFELKRSEMVQHVLQNTETKHITLAGLPKAPRSKAMVHWDPRTKRVLLVVNDLPAAPSKHQYQLWAIQNGKPVNAGLYNPEDTVMGLQQMNNIADAEAFAMTLEPAGGSINPTTEEMYLLGKL